MVINSFKLALKEVEFLSKLSSLQNPYLVRYHGHIVERKDSSTHVFWILEELGRYGTLWDMLAKKVELKQTFSEKKMITIATVLTKALEYVHSNGFIHCDFKVENILKFDNDELKLCDFGSVNTFDIDFKQMDPDKMYKYEEIFEKETTLMYRPPEMCDPYLGYKVNTKADIWMLGCVLFTLMFFKHPFAESSKLSITNAVYQYPVDNEYSLDLEVLVRNLLTPDPDLRPDAKTVLGWLEKLNSITKKEGNADRKQVLELNSMSYKISMEHNKRNRILQTGKYRKRSQDLKPVNLKAPVKKRMVGKFKTDSDILVVNLNQTNLNHKSKSRSRILFIIKCF